MYNSSGFISRTPESFGFGGLSEPTPKDGKPCWMSCSRIFVGGFHSGTKETTKYDPCHFHLMCCSAARQGFHQRMNRHDTGQGTGRTRCRESRPLASSPHISQHHRKKSHTLYKPLRRSRPSNKVTFSRGRFHFFASILGPIVFTSRVRRLFCP